MDEALLAWVFESASKFWIKKITLKQRIIQETVNELLNEYEFPLDISSQLMKKWAKAVDNE